MYQNLATALSQALIVFLLDISRSMGRPMPGGKSRLEIVLDALNMTYTEMIARSRKGEGIRPRYRIALYAYSDDVYDIYEGIRTIDEIDRIGLPDLKIENGTNMAAGFYHVLQLLKKDIASWSAYDRQVRPAPLVVHLTDVEITERFEDPFPITREIREIQVPDGNVLIENIFVTDLFKIPVGDISVWPGFPAMNNAGRPYETGNPLADRLLRMSSVIPESYREVINRNQHLSLQAGSLMMYPGDTPDIVQNAFMMSRASEFFAESPRPDDDQWREPE